MITIQLNLCTRSYSHERLYAHFSIYFISSQQENLLLTCIETNCFKIVTHVKEVYTFTISL